MLADRIEAKWIDAFCEIFERCAVKPGDTAAILSETQSRALNVHLAELALLRMGAKPFHIVVPTPRNREAVPIRSTGASIAIQRLGPVVSALQQAGFVVDCTVEGLMHAVETPEILKAGARILNISNEHPEALERMVPDSALEKRVRAAVKMLRGTKWMRVTSKAGTELDVDMMGASTVGVWGWTDKPGTLAHWPGGIVVSFPRSGTVNGTLVMAAGDINLTFKRYLTSPVRMTLKNDYVTNLEGEGADARTGEQDHAEGDGHQAAEQEQRPGAGGWCELRAVGEGRRARVDRPSGRLREPDEAGRGLLREYVGGENRARGRQQRRDAECARADPSGAGPRPHEPDDGDRDQHQPDGAHDPGNGDRRPRRRHQPQRAFARG